MADAQDLKSCDPYRSYRFDPGLRHQSVGKKDWAETYSARSDHKNIYKRRGVEQLVARRAHNPEAAGSNPVPATKTFTADDLTSAGRQRFCVFPGGDPPPFCARSGRQSPLFLPDQAGKGREDKIFSSPCLGRLAQGNRLADLSLKAV